MSLPLLEYISNQIEFIAVTEEKASVTNELEAEILEFLLKHLVEAIDQIADMLARLNGVEADTRGLRIALDELREKVNNNTGSIEELRKIVERLRSLAGNAYDSGLQLPCVDVYELDTMGGDGSFSYLRSLVTDNSSSRYTVMATIGGKRRNVGILDILSDSAGHTLTQILTTHYTLKSNGTLDPSLQTEANVLHAFRTFRFTEEGAWGSNAQQRGKWGPWKTLKGAGTHGDRRTLINLRSFYLATWESSDVGFDHPGWTTEVQQPDNVNVYLWVYEELTWLEQDAETTTVERISPHIIGSMGRDTVTVEISSDSGTAFRNGQGKMVLTARVFRGTEEITSSITPEYFSWQRESSNSVSDEIWNDLHEGVGRVITITAQEVLYQAQFTCLAILEF